MRNRIPYLILLLVLAGCSSAPQEQAEPDTAVSVPESLTPFEQTEERKEIAFFEIITSGKVCLTNWAEIQNVAWTVRRLCKLLTAKPGSSLCRVQHRHRARLAMRLSTNRQNMETWCSSRHHERRNMSGSIWAINFLCMHRHLKA